MRLQHTGHRREVGGTASIAPWAISRVTKACHAEPRGGQVDVRAVAGDDAIVLEALQPGGHGGPGDAGDARQLQRPGARVLAAAPPSSATSRASRDRFSTMPQLCKPAQQNGPGR